MPSTSEPQARLMAAIAHGWHPSGLKHAPSRAVATEFNQADKGSRLLSDAMKHRHATGGLAMFNQNPNYLSALAMRGGLQGSMPMAPQGAPPQAQPRPMQSGPAMRPPGAPLQPATAPTQSALQMAGARPGGSMPAPMPGGQPTWAPRAMGPPGAMPGALGAAMARPPVAHFALGGSTLGASSLAAMPHPHGLGAPPRAIYPGTAHMRMPRIPITDTMRNIDQKIGNSGVHLKRLAMGGQMPPPELGPEGAQAVQKALQHLQARNPSGAIQSLQDSRQAMAHPIVAAAARHLAGGQNIMGAHAALRHVANQHARKQFARQNANALATAQALPAGAVPGQ